MKTLALGALEKAINQYIQLDPDVENLLEPLIDKIIAIEFQGLSVSLYCLFTAKSIQLLNKKPQIIDASISASPLSYLTMACDQGKTDTLLKGKMQISGDAEVAQQANHFFQQLEIDWEEHLSRYTGDTVAHTIGQLIRNSCAWINSTKTTMTKNIGEFLQEEVALVPPKEEIDDFMNDVDKLRQDVDRLNAKIQQRQLKDRDQ